MPYGKKRVSGGWEVYNRDTGAVYAMHTSKDKADKQIRLLNGIKHGLKPRKK